MRQRITAALLLLTTATWLPTWADTHGAATVVTQDPPQAAESAWDSWVQSLVDNDGIDPWVWYLVVILGVVALFCLLYYIYMYRKEQQMTRLIHKANHRFSLILKTSNVQMFTYTVATDTYGFIGLEGKVVRSYSSREFFSYMPPDDAALLREVIGQVVCGELERKKVMVKTLNPESGEYKDYVADVTVLRRNSDGTPAVLLGTRSDISEQRSQQLKTQDTIRRYQAIFNTPMVDMMYYDERGLVADINQKGCDTFHSSKEDMQARTEPVYERIGMTKEWFQTFDSFHSTLNLGDIQYELQLTPVTDNEGRRIGFYGTGLDVTPVRAAFNEQRQRVQELEKANEKIKSYVDNINYALQAGGVRIAIYSPYTHLLKFFSEIDKVQYSFTQSRCFRLCHTEWISQAARAFDSMDNCSDKLQVVEIKTALKAREGVPLFLSFHLVPTYDAEGRVANYFGICRDVSEIRYTQEQLSEETVKMQEVEAVKNAFLHNMSFEIRTPLTTVVGFSELFQMPHTAEEERVFVKEIKDNSRSLLGLVNNILFLSRLDAKMIEIRPKPVDLAKKFDALCREGWDDHQVKGVSYLIENPFQQFSVNIDIQNLGIIISQIVANAAQHTKRGFVRARYDYSGTALTVVVEDSGSGIPEKALTHIFERFVTGANTGAGLGLSICYELVQLMGGDINIKSKKGKGTAVWVSIPCQVIEYERK